MRASEAGIGGVRLLIADDEDMFAELVEALVAPDDRITVVGRARNGEESIELARRLRPNVIVMDIGMPVMDGIEATRRIRRADPSVGVVIFTGSDEARDVRRAREVGAAAYVARRSSSPAATSKAGSPRESGHEVVAK
jgi:two-component system, NarL family, response regulator LiaR